jgi:hypothetical protein
MKGNFTAQLSDNDKLARTEADKVVEITLTRMRRHQVVPLTFQQMSRQ